MTNQTIAQLEAWSRNPAPYVLSNLAEYHRMGAVMDPLVAGIMALASPFLVKGAEEFAKSFGSDAYDAAKALVNRLSAWWADKPVARAVAENMGDDPEGNSAILSGVLERELSQNPTFKAELESLMSRAGPFVTIVQRIERGEDIEGADIGAIRTGTVAHEQDIGVARNVRGPKIDSIG